MQDPRRFQNSVGVSDLSVFKQSIDNARDAIEDTKNLISEYKDLYQDMHHNANLLLDASENAISIGLNTIDYMNQMIEIDE